MFDKTLFLVGDSYSNLSLIETRVLLSSLLRSFKFTSLSSIVNAMLQPC